MYPPLLASFTPALISCMGPPSIARSQMNCHGVKYMCTFSFLCTITSSVPLPSCFPGPITHPPTSVLPASLRALLSPLSGHFRTFQPLFLVSHSFWQPVLYFFHVFKSLLFLIFQAFYTALRVTFHLQLLQNISNILCVVQYILESTYLIPTIPILYPVVCASHFPISVAGSSLHFALVTLTCTLYLSLINFI